MEWALVAPVEEAKTLCAAGIRITPNTATIDIVTSNSVRVKAPQFCFITASPYSNEGKETSLPQLKQGEQATMVRVSKEVPLHRTYRL